MDWHEIATWFLIFIAYSCLGWLIEMAVTLLEHHRIYNRGFLIGPICPIYGVGAVLASWIFSGIDQAWLIFLLCMLGGGVLEYVTSFWMEACFHVRWWDYKAEPFNINGRTCLFAMLSIGLLGLLVIEVFTPGMLNFFAMLDASIIYIVAGVIFIIAIADLIWSLVLILHFRVAAGTVEADATAEIDENIKKVMMQRSKLDRRLVKAFPSMKVSQKKPHKKSSKKTS